MRLKVKAQVAVLALSMALNMNFALLGAPLELISKADQPRAGAFGDSSDIELSADGRWAVFVSSGTGLTTNDSSPLVLDVFLRDLETGSTSMLSRDEEDQPGNGHSHTPYISADGRVIVFETEADNLVPNDINEGNDVLLFERDTAVFTVISGTTNGVAEGSSGYPVMTANGRFVLFESNASGWSPADGNDSTDLYLFERETGEVKLVTLNLDNTAAATEILPTSALGALEGSVSGDGRYVAFVSAATNLVAGGQTNRQPQVYLRDMELGTNYWLSRTVGSQPSRFVSSPLVSSNGAFVLFLSEDLDVNSTTSRDVFLYRFNIDSGERQRFNDATGRALLVEDFNLSANGQYLAYTTSNQVYLHDFATGEHRLVSAAEDGTPGDGFSTEPQLSDDGRYVVFTSDATNLSSGAETASFQAYRFDRQTGEVVLLSRAFAGGVADSDVHFPVVSGDGALAGFMSFASNLVPNDNVSVNDVFVVPTSGAEPVALASVAHPASFSSSAAGWSSLDAHALSIDGKRLIFASLADDLVPNDTNEYRDIFLHDLQSGVTRPVNIGTNGAIIPGASTVIGASFDAGVIAFASSNLVNGTNTTSIFIFHAGTGGTAVENVLPTGEITADLAEAALSGNGRYLAFRVRSASAVYIRDLVTRTTVPVPVSNPAFFEIAGLSPGGRYLFGRQRPGSPLASVIEWRSNQLVTNLPVFFGSMSLDERKVLTQVSNPNGLGFWLTLLTLDQSAPPAIISTNGGGFAMSLDGSTVAYLLRPDAAAPNYNVFLYDVNTSAAVPVQIAGTNVQVGAGDDLVLSPTGRFLAIVTPHSLLTGVPGDTFNNIFIYDRVLGTLTLASENMNGVEAEFGSSSPSLSVDGLLAFESASDDFVSNDRNLASDVFVRRMGGVDSDNDGLEDGWETIQFGNLSAAPETDADSDGVTNLDEFRAGTDPQSAASLFVMRASFAEETRTLSIVAPAAFGKTYQLQRRASLAAGEWEDAGVPTISLSGEAEFQISIEDLGNAFFRVRTLE